MYFSITEARGTGDAMLLAVVPYLDKAHITVYIDGLATEAFTWINAQAVSVIVPLNHLVRVVRRTSPGVRLTEYLNGRPLPGQDLEVDSKQAFYMAQEAYDLASMAGGSGAGTAPGGVQLTTEGILALLAGQITPSQLELALREEIGLINAPGSTPNSVAYRVAQEALARAQAIIAEAQQRSDALAQEALARGADIQTVTELLQTETGSLATQITQVTASTNQNSAAIQQEVTARTNAVSAVAGTINTIDANYRQADGNLDARITQVAAASSDADAALALRIDTVQASLGASENLFPGSSFDPASPQGWPASQLLSSSDSAVPLNAPSGHVLRASADLTNATLIPCEAGSILDCVTWAARPAAVGSFGFYLQFRDAAGAGVNGNTAVFFGTFSTASWGRFSGSIQVPATAVNFRVVMSQVVDTFYGAPDIQKRAEAFAAVEQSLNAVATRTAGVEANYTIKVQARSDGKNAIAGIGLNATSNGNVVQSEMVFLADKFTFVPSQSDLNVIPQPILVMGLVNGVNTLVVPPSRYGDQLIEARMIVDGGIQARHLTITGGHGQALNLDPTCSDASAWLSSGSLLSVNLSDGVSGNKALQLTGGGQDTHSLPFPVTPGKQYKVSAQVRRVSGTGVFYLRQYCYRADGSFINNSGLDWAVLLDNGAQVEAINLPTGAWTSFSGSTYPVPAGAATAVLVLITSHGGYGTFQLQNVKSEEMLDWSLVVQGGLRADRIDTRGLTIKDFSGNVLFGSGTGLDWSLLNNAPQDGSNLVRTPTFENGKGTWANNDVVGVTGADFTKAIRVTGRDNVPPTAPIYLPGGVDLYGEATIYSGNASVAITFGFEAHRADGSVINWIGCCALAAGVGWTRVRGKATTPPGTVYVLPWIQMGGFGAMGEAYLSLLYLGRQEVGATLGATFGSNIFGQINSANVSTYIANAAIGAAQIGQLTAGNLTVAELSKIVNGGVATGGRVNIGTQKIEVFDNSNVRRCLLGQR